MARVTVEDCVVKIPNRFKLVLLASQRARDLSAGGTPTLERENDKNPVIALREIAEESIDIEALDQAVVTGLQKHVEIDEPGDDSMAILAAAEAEWAGVAGDVPLDAGKLSAARDPAPEESLEELLAATAGGKVIKRDSSTDDEGEGESLEDLLTAAGKGIADTAAANTADAGTADETGPETGPETTAATDGETGPETTAATDGETGPETTAATDGETEKG